MKDFFKPEDFYKLSESADAYEIANEVNEKLNALIESWPVVYGKDNQWDKTDGRPDSYVGCTHKARLAFIEEIRKEPCKHEPKNYHPYAANFGYEKDIKCKYCGVELQATWSEKKNAQEFNPEKLEMGDKAIVTYVDYGKSEIGLKKVIE